MVDIKQAKRFLKRLNHKVFTFQYLRQRKAYGFDVWSYDEIDWKKLTRLNTKDKADIYIMVNEGDGLIHPPHKYPRSQKSVTHLTSLFIDTDECPLSEVQAFAKAHHIRPHLVVKTSPRKYHLYFLLSDFERRTLKVPSLKQTRGIWRSLQDSLTYLGTDSPRCDESVRDLSRVLRLPGFYHLKNLDTPHLVQITKEYFHKAYTLDELKSRLPAPQKGRSQSREYESDAQPYSLPTKKVGAGSRHLESTRFLGHLLKTGVSKKVALLAYNQFASTYLTEARDFLKGGKRRKEILEFITWKTNELAAQKEIDEKTNIKNAKNALKDPLPNTDPFALPDEFYLDTPGIVGEMTKYIHQTARYPSAPLAFAAAISLCGTLKSNCQRSQFGHAPSNYLLCLAPTGYGKNHPQEILSHSLNSLNLAHLIQQDVRSEKGVLRFLESQQSRGLLLLDEAETLFSSFQSKQTPHYLQSCKKLFLELYTSTNFPLKIMGRLGDKKDQPITLHFPALSILAYGVLHTVSESFSDKSIKDGLLQRFITISESGKRVFNKRFKPAGPFPEKILRELRRLVIVSKQSSEIDLQEIQELEEAFKDCRNSDERARVKERLSALILKERDSKKYILNFGKEAALRYSAFISKIDARINVLLDKSTSGGHEIYTRAAEQVGRLLTAMYSASGLGGSDLSISEYSHVEHFIETRTKALESLIERGLKDDSAQWDNRENSLIDRLVQQVAREQSATGRPVKMRTLWLQLNPRPGWSRFSKAVGSAIEADLLTQKNTSDGNRPSKSLCIK